MRTSRLIVFAVLSILLNVTPVHAQGYIAPSLGVTFANPSAQGRAEFAANLGWLPRTEPVGVELDLMYAPSFFGNQGPYGENSVTTVMGNVIVAAGGEGGRGRYGFRRRGSTAVRPYVSGGIGIMHEVVTTPVVANKIANDDLGVNLGFGVMAFTARSFGVRGDVRYFRDVVNNQRGNTTDIDFGAFHFWRGSIGIVLAF
jgi:hypothetical protein